MLKAVIFDYYETLVELVVPIRERMFDELARDVGVDLRPGEAYRQWRSLSLTDAEARFGGQEHRLLDGDAPPFVSFADAWERRFVELFASWGVDAHPRVGVEAQNRMHANAVPYPEVPAALDALRERYRLAVFSDADRGFLDGSLRASGMVFEAVLSSEDVRAYKPHKSVFQTTCARLGIEPSEAAYVGDTPYQDVEGARHAGLRAVWIDRHDREWPDDLGPPPDRVRALSELAELLVE